MDNINNTLEIISNLSIVKDLLFPIFVAVLGTNVWNHWLYKKKLEEEYRRKLYAPLQFYLMKTKILHITRDELLKANKDLVDARTKAMDSIKKEELIIENTCNIQKEIYNPIKTEWWEYVDKIKETIENNADCIKEDDWDLVQRFSKQYFLREKMFGKGMYEDKSRVYSFEKISEAADGIIDIIKEMEDKFL